MKRNAFTLAETLITLVIIGVIAALTVPTLMHKYVEHQTVTKLRETYSILSQAYKLTVLENGPPTAWGLPNLTTNWDATNANYVFDLMSPYLRFNKICKSAAGCWQNINYDALHGTCGWGSWGDFHVYGKGILQNGTLISVSDDYANCSGYCGRIRVDLNGQAEPNQYGVDTFFFEWRSDKGLVPTGTPYAWSMISSGYCNKTNTAAAHQGGIACAYWVIRKGNMDYLERNINLELY